MCISSLKKCKVCSFICTCMKGPVQIFQKDMDTHIGDLHSTIVDRELEIIQELLEEIIPSMAAILATCDVCAELDCLLSFSGAAMMYDYRRPHMVEENIIELIQAR